MTVRWQALIMAIVAWPGLGQPERAERLRVGVRVIDQAGVSPEVMQRATQEVSHILRQAGVEADWLHCPLGEQSPETRRQCNQKLGPMDFWLHLATHKLPGADQDNLGAALLEKAGGGVAYAYYRDIETSARDWRCDTSLVLAAVMAHEIGHLLLGGAHSRTGIMSAGLSLHSLALAKQGFLLFTPAQARRIRSNLSEAPQRARRVEALLALAEVSAVRGETAARITACVVNSAKVEERTLAQSEKQAGHVLAQAGIEVVWQDCSAGFGGACASELGRSEFWMHVANWRPAGRFTDLLGFTALDPDPARGLGRAGVYYPMVKQMASVFLMDEAPILGAAIAHEIGHLLGADHSLGGIMRARFSLLNMKDMDRGEFLFGRDQADRIRAVVMWRAVERSNAGGSPPSAR